MMIAVGWFMMIIAKIMDTNYVDTNDPDAKHENGDDNKKDDVDQVDDIVDLVSAVEKSSKIWHLFVCFFFFFMKKINVLVLLSA